MSADVKDVIYSTLRDRGLSKERAGEITVVLQSALAAAGLVVVPREPTDAMCDAARARHDADDRDADKYALYRSIGRAMIAAAPITASQEASDDAK